MRRFSPRVGCLVVLCFCASVAFSQLRPPATPLITHDPYFSIWSTTDNLADSDTSHLTGASQPIGGIARIDGKSYRFMGKHPENLPAMEQTSRLVTPTHTRYEFHQGGIALELTFFTPAIMADLDLLSRPVTYMSWTARATDGGTHRVSVLLDVDPVIAVNDRSQNVIETRHQTSRLHVLSVGSSDQKILNRSGDNLRIDWGYFHLAIPKDEPAETSVSNNSLSGFMDSGHLIGSVSMGMHEPVRRSRPHLATVLDFGSVDAKL